jgi:hypothetical protein
MNELNLFAFMLGFVTGGSLLTIIYLVKEILRNRKLALEGQRLVDKMVARKQVDFFYNETIRIFLMAAEAQQYGDAELLDKLASQHETATRRFQQARLNLLQMEQQ